MRGASTACLWALLVGLLAGCQTSWTEPGVDPATGVLIEPVGGVYLTHLDDEARWGGRGGGRGWAVKDITILPGDRRITVDWEVTRGNFIHFASNRSTLRHDFRPGQRYVVGVVEINELLVVPVLLEAGAREPIARPEGVEATPMDPPAPGTHRVAGAAAIRSGGLPLTATGREVRLLPNADEVDRWFDKHVDENGETSGWFTKTPPGWNRGRRTIGFGVGGFAFDDVPPGRYAVVFARVYGDVRNGTLAVFSHAIVDVPAAPGETRVLLGDAAVDGPTSPTPRQAPPAVDPRREPEGAPPAGRPSFR